jgi:hypothetical protein
MPIFASGMRLTPARLNRLQPATYFVVGSGSVAASQTNADVPSASITVTTAMPNAVYTAEAVWDVDLSGATTATWVGRINVDGSLVTPLATYAAEVATDRATVPQSYRGTLATAGSHTIKLVTTTGASQTVQGVNCSLLVVIYEVS